MQNPQTHMFRLLSKFDACTLPEAVQHDTSNCCLAVGVFCEFCTTTMHCHSQEAVSKQDACLNACLMGVLLQRQSSTCTSQNHVSLWWRTDLLTGWACNSLQPPELVVPHGPQPHAGEELSSQQRLIGGRLERHVHHLKRLCYLDLAMYAAELLLAIRLQCCSRLHKPSSLYLSKQVSSLGVKYMQS